MKRTPYRICPQRKANINIPPIRSQHCRSIVEAFHSTKKYGLRKLKPFINSSQRTVRLVLERVVCEARAQNSVSDFLIKTRGVKTTRHRHGWVSACAPCRPPCRASPLHNQNDRLESHT